MQIRTALDFSDITSKFCYVASLYDYWHARNIFDANIIY
jgi:hypothetical protein